MRPTKSWAGSGRRRATVWSRSSWGSPCSSPTSPTTVSRSRPRLHPRWDSSLEMCSRCAFLDRDDRADRGGFASAPGALRLLARDRAGRGGGAAGPGRGAPRREVRGSGRLVAMATTQQVQLKHKVEGRMGEVLTPQALGFVARLQRAFGERRQELLRLRDERQTRIEAGGRAHALVTTNSVRDSDWRGAKAPNDLQDRRVEITRPTDRTMPLE